jgi:GT2 family glycosyltransferase
VVFVGSAVDPAVTDRSKATEWPSVSVIVLNWNRCADTLDCLESLARLDYPNVRVILVDNASVDGTVAAVRERHPEVDVVENSENLGYAEGNNVGLRLAQAEGADFVLLLNNDTVVRPDFLTHLVATLRARPDAGVAGPTILFHDHPNVIWSAGGSVSARDGRSSMIGLREAEATLPVEPREVEFVTGCALLTRREAIEHVGYLDPRFFTYYEETEFCARVRRAGFQVLHVPRSRIWHKISLEKQEASARVTYYMVRNRLLFLKLAGYGRVPLWRAVLGDLKMLASWSVRPQHRESRALRRTVARALGDFVLGRYGKADVGDSDARQPKTEIGALHGRQSPR